MCYGRISGHLTMSWPYLCVVGPLLFQRYMLSSATIMSSSWGKYLAQGVQEPIYHMCEIRLFETATANGSMYYPPTYPQDGFIHATKEPQFLIDVANHFYKESNGDWICIKLEPMMLPPVIFESPAPVGTTAAYEHDGDSPKFPRE